MVSADVRVVVLLTAWGAGSSAVAGFLDACGAYTCPPHHSTNDPRTPNSYEPAALQQALADAIDETTLQPKSNAGAFADFFESWLTEEKAEAARNGSDTIVLKHALQVFLLPALDRIAMPEYIVITRPYPTIEQTRQRRGWHSTQGEAGAKIIYNAIYSYMHGAEKPYLAMPFDRFRNDAAARSKLLQYIDLEPGPDALAKAEAWLT